VVSAEAWPRGEASWPARGLGEHLREDRRLYLAIGTYGLASFLLSLSAGDAARFIPFVYVVLWLRTGAVAVVAVVATAGLVAALTGRGPALRAWLARVSTPRRMAGAVMLAALLVFHGLFTSTKTILVDIVPFTHDRLLANLDAALHGGDAWRRLVLLRPLTPALQVLYSVGWVSAMLGVTAYACLEAPPALRRQYLWSLLLCWVLLGNLVAAIGMSAGPVFYAGVLGEHRFDGLIRSLDQLGVGGALDCRALLWSAYVHHRAGVGTGISAFPSLHVSTAALLVLFLRRVDRRVAAGALAFAAVIFVSSVHLGWHYAVDGYAAMAGTAAIWWSVGRGLRLDCASYAAAELRQTNPSPSARISHLRGWSP
jgi:hypothetical protein